MEKFIRKERVSTSAQLAVNLMQHFAIVAGEPDGVDNVGRQKMRLLTPEEVVSRACEIADAAYTQFKERGWVYEVIDDDSVDAVWNAGK